VTASEPMPKEGGIELERIIFFSDAVFAIAITLLVLDIKVPARPAILKEPVPAWLGGQLSALSPSYLSYVLSFLVIGAFWAAHHRIFRYITGYDGRLIAVNTLLLMCVAFRHPHRGGAVRLRARGRVLLPAAYLVVRLLGPSVGLPPHRS
jgi:uncharacterized membrane protein